MIQKTKKNILEYILGLFTEVKGGEGFTVILLFFNIFLIFTAYYIMKPVREALILAGGGAEIKAYASAGQAILLLGAVPLYSMIANRFNRKKLINTVTFFFIGCLVVFYLLALIRVPLGVIFFLWIGIFNLMVPAQFWAFANDIYTPESGKRLFVIVAFGASLGAVLGGIITRELIEPLGVYQLLLFSGALLGLSLVFTNIVDAKEKPTKASNQNEFTQKPKKSFNKTGAFKMVFQTRYLLLIALLMMTLNWVNTTGEYILARTIERSAKIEAQNPTVITEAEEYAKQQSTDAANAANNEQYKNDYLKKYIGNFIGKFYADFYTIVNIVSLLFQLFIVSRILKYFGVRIAILFLPVIALGGYFIIAFYPILSIVRWAKTAENSIDYSLQNTVRQVLFLPTTTEQKYKAKQAIDSFFVRAGDVLSAVLVYVGTTWLNFETKQFALFVACLVFVWLVLAFWIGKLNQQMTSNA